MALSGEQEHKHRLNKPLKALKMSSSVIYSSSCFHFLGHDEQKIFWWSESVRCRSTSCHRCHCWATLNLILWRKLHLFLMILVNFRGFFLFLISILTHPWRWGDFPLQASGSRSGSCRSSQSPRSASPPSPFEDVALFQLQSRTARRKRGGRGRTETEKLRGCPLTAAGWCGSQRWAGLHLMQVFSELDRQRSLVLLQKMFWMDLSIVLEI